MTSSFTTMVFTGMGLGLLDAPAQLATIAGGSLGAAGQRVIQKQFGDMLKTFAEQEFRSRVLSWLGGFEGGDAGMPFEVAGDDGGACRFDV